jgi:integrase/recombinase XerD
MLSAVLLDTLRQYWKAERPTPWLFPGKDPAKPMTTKAVFLMVQKTGVRAKLAKAISPHTLRHYAGFRTIPGDCFSSATGGSFAQTFPA